MKSFTKCIRYFTRIILYVSAKREKAEEQNNSCLTCAELAGPTVVERMTLATGRSVHVSFSNTYVFDVYKLIAGVGGRFNGADTRAAENDFLGLSRRKAGRCVWHGSSTGLLLKSPVNSSSAIYRIQADIDKPAGNCQCEEFPSCVVAPRWDLADKETSKGVIIDTSGLRETICRNALQMHAHDR